MKKEILAGAAIAALVLGGAGPGATASPTDANAGAAASAGMPSQSLNRNSVFNTDRIALSAKQEQVIWQAASALRTQGLPPDVVAFPGARLPESIALTDIPAGVRNAVGDGKLDGYRLARVEAGVAIVDPADHTVHAVVTLQEGTGRALAPSGAPVRTLETAAGDGGRRIDDETVFNETPIARQRPETMGAGPRD